MFGKLAAVAVAVGVSFALAPIAQADPDPSDPLRVDLNAGTGWVSTNGYWYGSEFGEKTFTVTVTDNHGKNDDTVNVFVSLPTDRLEVVGYDGDDWNCWDVAGGIECENDDTVVPQQAWPALTVTVDSHGLEVTDTFDAYANTANGSGHDSAAVKMYPQGG
jgi:hypothetical protein